MGMTYNCVACSASIYIHTYIRTSVYICTYTYITHTCIIIKKKHVNVSMYKCIYLRICVRDKCLSASSKYVQHVHTYVYVSGDLSFPEKNLLFFFTKKNLLNIPYGIY